MDNRFGINTVFNSINDFPKAGSGFGVNREALTLYDGFILPAYSRIIFVNYSESADAALIAINTTGTYTANRRNGVWQDGVTFASSSDLNICGLPIATKVTDLHSINRSCFFMYEYTALNIPVANRGGLGICVYASSSWILLMVVPFSMGSLYVTSKVTTWKEWTEK